MNRAERLARANLAYRDPALYDDMAGEDRTADTVARITATTIGTNDRRSVLDMGCAAYGVVDWNASPSATPSRWWPTGV